MLTLKLALRTLLKRKARMALIGSLVAFGTILLVLGGTFASSVAVASKRAIIDSFTGDFIVYSDRSEELPSPFAFQTPLPAIRDLERLEQALGAASGVQSYAFYAQNYGLLQVERDGKKYDLPFIFYAIDPNTYRSLFNSVEIREGDYFGLAAGHDANPEIGVSGSTAKSSPGILISRFQNEQYRKNYGVTLAAGEPLTALGVTEGGVNTVRSVLAGIFEPLHYRSVFDYINFMDSATYAELYAYSGVEALPDAFNAGLDAASADEASLFALADIPDFGRLDLDSLTQRSLSGETMAAVKLEPGADAAAVIESLLADASLGIKIAPWDVASGFYARIASAIQALVFGATGLVFLVVTMIFMNTLIINVVERSAEIGTMRALGAEKSFIRGVFLAEALVLNVSAALLSMALSGIVLSFASSRGLPLPETISQFLIGGGPLDILISPAPFLFALLTVVLVSVLATVYPVRVATSITPLKAMSER